MPQASEYWDVQKPTVHRLLLRCAMPLSANVSVKIQSASNNKADIPRHD
jgi:hypothetical protein